MDGWVDRGNIMAAWGKGLGLWGAGGGWFIDEIKYNGLKRTDES